MEAFDRQIILFNEYINEISNKKSIRLKFNNNQIDKLNDLNNEELFDAFVISNKGNTKLNSENLHKLGSHISYLEISIQNIKEKFNEFREENKNWTEHWNTSFLEFGKIIMDYITKHKRNYGKNIEDIFLLKEKLNELGKTDQVPSEVVFNEFITPIRKIFSHHLNLNHDDISLNGIKSSERLNALILQKNHLYKTHIEGIEDYKKQISYTLEKSKEIVEYFKNQ
ncbi:hypothetical protein [Algoriphagus boseongensis]|uniref:hypothetical protein n=1 Tax=Algoriphagus boseongensis TaxID=1442587 RepID=UPI001414E2F2|nr:hypothetical protein [Algoriphagus boseongensis]